MGRTARYGHLPTDVRHTCIAEAPVGALLEEEFASLKAIRAKHAKPARNPAPSAPPLPSRLAGAIALFGLLPAIHIGMSRRRENERKANSFNRRATGKSLVSID